MDDKNRMADEYDFTGGMRGKYAKAFAQGTNLIMLDPDVAQFFPDAEATNEALRRILADESLCAIARSYGANKSDKDVENILLREYIEGSEIVFLYPDVHEFSSSSKQVNAALRLLMSMSVSTPTGS